MEPPGVREDGIGPELPSSRKSQRLRAVEVAMAETAPRIPERSLHNLPLQLSSFVGREKELAEVKRLLKDNRLLTLTGSGGCGKTRLALAAAAELVEGFEDGVWLVELASQVDPSLVAQSVATTLGVREQPGRSLTETLSDHLGFKKMLLVLDNCEHLVEGCAELTEALLRSCPRLRILVTSREALSIAGEVAWPVPSLSLPDLRRLPAVESLPRYEAARLFVERAVAVKPTFAITEQNAPAVARACYRLDGIPLAIELAAARVKVLSVEQIANRLDDSFALLSDGSRTAMPHHRTLRATMDWSYELLSDEERILFRRLSVFAGDFRLEAAESVCAGKKLEWDEVLDLLSHLVDKSLVTAQEKGDEASYRLLEMMRQYGMEKLDEVGEADEVKRHHAAFFLGLAERVEPELNGPEQVSRLDELESENDNLRVAMIAALMSYAQGDYRACERYSPEALELSRRASDEPCAAYALTLLGLGAMHRRDFEEATSRFEEALILLRRAGEEQTVPLVLVWLGNVSLAQENRERATRMFEEALALARQRTDRLATNIALYNLAQLALTRADLGVTARLLKEGLTSSRQMGDQANLSYFLEGLAVIAGARGEAERAVRMLGAAAVTMEEAGAPVYNYYTPDRVLYERIVAAARSRLGEAAWKAGWDEGRAMTPEQAVEYALEQEAVPEPTASEVYPAGLSAREAEVLRLVATGLTNAEVAEKLFLSSRTIDWHMSSIYRKLGFHSRTEATRFAVEHDLL